MQWRVIHDSSTLPAPFPRRRGSLKSAMLVRRIGRCYQIDMEASLLAVPGSRRTCRWHSRGCVNPQPALARVFVIEGVSTMKDYKRFLDEPSIGDRKSSGYCHWRGAWQEIMFGRLPASKTKTAWRRLRLAAVVDGGNRQY